MLNVLYLVHDLADPATRRRVMMLRAGGAEIALAGFRRTEQPILEIDGIRPVDLGMTRDGKFAQRLMAVARASVRLGAAFHALDRPDVIIARNLEMLALAHRANAVFGADIPIVYECLDIHRLLLKKDFIGSAMRAAERWLGRDAALLITSSPAFLREYFVPHGQIKVPTLLLQNKVLELADSRASITPAPVPASGQPWKIGWFGALRCRRSLELLSALTKRMNGRFEVVLRGRPARSEFADFDAAVAEEPFIRFEGPYRNPDDLAAIYGEVHFTWAMDFFEEGLNSDWLLPNRLYEGCRHGVVPIAMRRTETGRFLLEHGVGLLLEQVTAEAVEALLSDIDPETYAAERRRVTSKPSETWVCDREDCRALVARLSGLSRPAMAARTVESMA
ncbi:succinoglycan biosynthesis protein ExoL [Mesorhizobium sp. J18]|uniref:glycosyltransferase n=1 Tax=Mesorhizobium sp. J18 TaxID=935263 RepID=UPI00119BCC9B|nr:glycosyltransferase [Mesorhizobium sp. J18]TWG93036.1 succinoglycan biosynthesis protein ExoL [Mesorhizobium sp. J18]